MSTPRKDSEKQSVSDEKAANEASQEQESGDTYGTTNFTPDATDTTNQSWVDRSQWGKPTEEWERNILSVGNARALEDGDQGLNPHKRKERSSILDKNLFQPLENETPQKNETPNTPEKSSKTPPTQVSQQLPKERNNNEKTLKTPPPLGKSSTHAPSSPPPKTKETPRRRAQSMQEKRSTFHLFKNPVNQFRAPIRARRQSLPHPQKARIEQRENLKQETIRGKVKGKIEEIKRGVGRRLRG
ncbi:MAG: hypothetical protein KIT56_07000 [Gammaproteobacteria bacterium]|nr:hypothetical protein [Gammaproteobacteria bacterium]MCW5583612.1 hypothetical protein [Gammaproteobacteria bacterium]